MPHLPFHPAMGMAAMMPGTWTLPQNPIQAGAILYQPTLGEMMPAYFTVPENPLLDRLLYGLSGCRGGSRCGCGGCGGCDVGMGAVSEGMSLGGWWESVKAGDISSLAIGGAVLLGAMFLLRGRGRKR